MKKRQSEEDLDREDRRRDLGIAVNALLLAPGDDAALWSPGAGHETILTCDWFLEGTHFLRDKHPADAVGWKCLARAVSDIAAMGGEPRCFLLSLALPPELTGKWLDEFLRGLRRASKALRCELAGGDTTRRDEVLISITVIGEVRDGAAILRSVRAPGDAIFVSGTLGEADLGLRELRRMRGMAKPANAALRKASLSAAALGTGAMVGAKWLCHGDDGSFGWTFDGFAASVCGERCWRRSCMAIPFP